MLIAARQRLHRRLERRFAPRRSLKSIAVGRDPRRARELKARRASPWLDRTSAISAGKPGARARLDQRLHVGAAAGNQDRRARSLRHRLSVPRVTTRLRRRRATSSPMRTGASPASMSAVARLALALGRDERHHAEAAIERAQHLRSPQRRPSTASQPKTGGGAKASRSSATASDRVEHARQVVGKAAAGDMRERDDRPRAAERLKQRLHIKPRRRQQRFRQASAFGLERRGRVPASPDRSTMRRTSENPLECDARRGQAENRVASLEARPRQQRPALGRADRKAREVEIARRIKARHFRRLAADQRAARLGAARGDPLHDRGVTCRRACPRRNSRGRKEAPRLAR